MWCDQLYSSIRVYAVVIGELNSNYGKPQWNVMTIENGMEKLSTVVVCIRIYNCHYRRREVFLLSVLFFFLIFLLFICPLFHSSSSPKKKNEKGISDVDLSAAWISNIGAFIMYFVWCMVRANALNCIEITWKDDYRQKVKTKSPEMNEKFHFFVCALFSSTFIVSFLCPKNSIHLK